MEGLIDDLINKNSSNMDKIVTKSVEDIVNGMVVDKRSAEYVGNVTATTSPRTSAWYTLYYILYYTLYYILKC